MRDCDLYPSAIFLKFNVNSQLLKDGERFKSVCPQDLGLEPGWWLKKEQTFNSWNLLQPKKLIEKIKNKIKIKLLGLIEREGETGKNWKRNLKSNKDEGPMYACISFSISTYFNMMGRNKKIVWRKLHLIKSGVGLFVSMKDFER